MSPKTSPAPRADSADSGRRGEAPWPPDDGRARDDLAFMGLVDDLPASLDPSDRLTELAVGRTAPDRRRRPRGLDSAWATRRII